MRQWIVCFVVLAGFWQWGWAEQSAREATAIGGGLVSDDFASGTQPDRRPASGGQSGWAEMAGR
jgi:hypothetical protein